MGTQKGGTPGQTKDRPKAASAEDTENRSNSTPDISQIVWASLPWSFQAAPEHPAGAGCRRVLGEPQWLQGLQFWGLRASLECPYPTTGRSTRQDAPFGSSQFVARRRRDAGKTGSVLQPAPSMKMMSVLQICDLRFPENVRPKICHQAHALSGNGQFAAVLEPMNDQTRVLVTGSDGFVGRHLVPYLAAQGHKVIAASRATPAFETSNIVPVPLPDLSMPFDWQPLLQQCDIVIHLAGIAHRFASDDLYDQVNHRATAALAEAAFRCGIKHLVFVSSIAAQSGSSSDHELTEDEPPRPNNPYGRSKLAAEKAVRAAGVSYTILRPVVIYGEGKKGISQPSSRSHVCQFRCRSGC